MSFEYVSGGHGRKFTNMLLASAAMALVSAHGALAQSAPVNIQPQSAASDQVAAASDGKVEEVTISTDAYANAKAIAAKRDLSVVSDGISSNEIGELPEFGLGDALSAVPGISFVINNGRGEDQFMTIRGLNPDYDTTTIDGMALPSTEETVRSLSFDVLPAVLINQGDVKKTWTVDQPSDAVGGVTDLHTRSAFDHPGTFVSGHVDGAYWDYNHQVKPNTPSGQGDLVVSHTWGSDDRFGFLVLGSFYERDSSTLNTYTLPWSYYSPNSIGQNNVFALDQTSATASNTTLKPTDNVSGLIPVPDRHRWYFYDNVRSRPGLFTRLDFDDHEEWHASLSGGVFTFINNEDRYSQYLNRVGGANITSATTGSFSQGSAEVDYDTYVQLRKVSYVNFAVGADFTPQDHLNLTFNYGYGHYRQTTDEDQFLQGTSTNLAFNYDLTTETSPLFTPVNQAAFMNPSLYSMAYHLNAVDQSYANLPQGKVDYSHNFGAHDQGLGFDVGGQYRDLIQTYSYWQYRVNPVGTAPTLAQVGTLNQNLSLYNGYGQSLLLVNPMAVTAYVGANPGAFSEFASDPISNSVNNYRLVEGIADGYAQADYRFGNLYALAGVRYESTRQNISNYLPVPFNSTTNFQATTTAQTYDKFLPSLNVSYAPMTEIMLRGAITQTLARPEYSQLAENSSATVSGAVASESISNPHLVPRESTNYDVSVEYYPAPTVVASVALFDKQISHEIVTLSSTQQNVSIPGYATPVTLTTTTPQNVGNATVRGIELNFIDASFSFLPGLLSGLGARGNISLIDMDAPNILMSNGTQRHLPQLIASSRSVANAALLYNYGIFGAELSYNYTSKQPISFDTNNAVNDQWWAAISTLDAQFRLALSPNWDVRAQAKNLLDSTPQKVVGQTQQLNYSTLENGRAYFVGVAFHY